MQKISILVLTGFAAIAVLAYTYFVNNAALTSAQVTDQSSMRPGSVALSRTPPLAPKAAAPAEGLQIGKTSSTQSGWAGGGTREGDPGVPRNLVIASGKFSHPNWRAEQVFV